MHPDQLFNACTQLAARVLTFRQPADTEVARYFRESRAAGSRERVVIADTVYELLRRWRYYMRLAQCDEHQAVNEAMARKLVILAFQADAAIREAALNAPEKQWLADAEARAQAVRAADAACRHNLPDWLAHALQEQLGQTAWTALAQSLLQPATLDVRANVLQIKRAALHKELLAAGIACAPTTYSPWGLRMAGRPVLGKLDAFTRGALEVQDEGSQLLALLADARRGEMVADFCAGAGGKTLAMGACMRNTGRLYALDVSAHRLQALKPRLARSRLDNVHTIALDSAGDARLQHMAAKLDRVLVDAPCSGTGTLRRSPDLKWRIQPGDVQSLAQTQCAILHNAARLVKPGGRLVYATCSLLRQENEEVAEQLSKENPLFVPVPAAQVLESLKMPHAADLCNDGMPSGHPPAGLYLRLWPHLHATDGFFAALWQRKN